VGQKPHAGLPCNVVPTIVKGDGLSPATRHDSNHGTAAEYRKAGFNPRSHFMKNIVRTNVVLALTLALAGAMAMAEDGASIYKTKCASCHGATGTPNPGMAKMMGIKPVGDPEMKKLNEAAISTAIKSGKGKMKPVAGLTDPQVKEVAAYFKSLK